VGDTRGFVRCVGKKKVRISALYECENDKKYLLSLESCKISNGQE